MSTPDWNMIDQYTCEYDSYNCVFLDILGYKNRVKDFFDNKYNLYDRVSRALGTAFGAIKTSHYLLGKSDFIIKIISDSIIILQPSSEGLAKIALFTSIFASCLSYEELYIRGGISRGRHFERYNDDIGFILLASEALQKAYEIESKLAVYPRIILDKEIFPNLTSIEKDYLIHNGEFAIIDFAHHVINRDGNNYDHVFAEMKEIKESMNKINNDHIKEKYQWLLDYYYWTIQQNPKWDHSKFKEFPSPIDRQFSKISS